MAAAWFHMSADAKQIGPMPEHAIFKLLKRAILPPNALVWTQGKTEWECCNVVEPFKEAASAMMVPWSYLDHAGTTIGPLIATQLLEAFEAGDVDGMTSVWSPGMSEWLPMAQVTGLKLLLSGSQLDDEEHEDDAGAPDPASAFDPAAMVFEAAEDQQPVLDDEVKAALAAKKGAGGAIKEGKKRFVSDDGKHYVWDEEEGGWIEADAEDLEDEDEEEEEEEETPAWKIKLKHKKDAERAAKKEAKSKKRKLAKDGDTPAEEEQEDGSDDNAEDKASDKKDTGENGAGKSKKKRKKSTWSAQGRGRWVYVKGLPADVKEDEVKEHFTKAGILATDPVTQAPRIKIYRDDEGQAKGDASVCYAMEDSVGLALQVLDGSQLRAGVFLEVTQAVFQPKGEKVEKMKGLKGTDARVKVARAAAKQALSWGENDDSGAAKGGLKIVVIENMFDPQDFVKDPEFGTDLQADLEDECSKLGPLEKLTVFSRNPLGPVVVKFGTAFAAEECVKLMEGRWFGARKLRCHYWDGVTNYVVAEAEGADEKRLAEFGDWLESQELPEHLQLRKEEAT